MGADVHHAGPPSAEPQGVRGNERIAALSDGVFAIAITLLALELRVPESPPPEGLIALVPALLPRFAAHIVSFAVLGIYWVGHHNMFMHIKRHDRILMWLNILFLLFVASMPFFAGLVIEWGNDRAAVIAYAGTLVLAGLALDGIWAYATHRGRLVNRNVQHQLVALVHRRVLLAPAIYLLAIAVSFWSLALTKLLFAAVVVAYVVPGPLDFYHHRQLGAAEESLDQTGAQI